MLAMSPHTEGRSRGRRAPLAVSRCLPIALVASGCSHAPTINLFGSFFPAWMLCAALGILAAVIVRQLLAVSGINEYVVAPLLTYSGLALTGTLLIWLFWFGH